jgi:hypothetical protein
LAEPALLGKSTSTRTIYRPLTLRAQHRGSSQGAPIMTYILSRAFIVLTAWAATCGLINSAWSDVQPSVFVVAAASWALAGFVCFGYMHRLRREAQE